MKSLTLGNVTLDLPLSADLDGLHGASYVDTSDKNRTLATLETDGHRELATLFAASPDLLLAAEQVVKESEPPADESDWEPSRIRFGAALDNLRTAIACARGRKP